MKISYDSEIDALYIRLVEGKHECRTLQLTDEIALNLGDNELLVGIEILDAKEVLGTGNIPQVTLENRFGRTNCLRMIHFGRRFLAPLHRDKRVLSVFSPGCADGGKAESR